MQLSDCLLKDATMPIYLHVCMDMLAHNFECRLLNDGEYAVFCPSTVVRGNPIVHEKFSLLKDPEEKRRFGPT